MKKIISYILLFFFATYIQGQEKTYLDYLNENSFTYPGCEDSEDKDLCFQAAISNLILDELNNSEIIFDQEFIKIMIRVDNLGKAVVIENKVENHELKLISSKALKNIPFIEPAFSKEEAKPITRSWGFYVKIKRKDGLYNLIETKAKFDPKSEPYPNLTDEEFKHAVCEGCEKSTNAKKCLKNKINKLLNEHLKQGEFATENLSSVINININQNAIINKVTSYTGNYSLDKKIETIVLELKIIESAKKGKNKINVSYTIPIEINTY